MHQEKILDIKPERRIKEALREATRIYASRISKGYYQPGLEDTFKMQLGSILAEELELMTFLTGERFLVLFEENMPINGADDYVDIVVSYKTKDVGEKRYLIELKFKKKKQFAQDFGVIDSYQDIWSLEQQRSSAPVLGCAFIFLTDYVAYTKEATTGTRKELPMHEGALIKANKQYKVTGKAAMKKTEKRGHVFSFERDYRIHYRHFRTDGGQEYWYYVLTD